MTGNYPQHKMLAGILSVGIVIVTAGVIVFSRQPVSPPITTIAIPTSIVTPTYGDAIVENVEPYTEYTPNAFAAASGKKRIYFFHATWCPTCKVAHEDFTKNASQIPAGVIVFKTDYDKETALKKQYAITYQHTFVQVDANGNEITKWNGGGVTELISNLK